MAKQFLIVGILFPLISAFVGGVYDPAISDYMNKHIASHHRATVLSLQSLAMRLLSTIIAPFFGWMVDFWSLKSAFLVAVIILIIDLFILSISFMIIERKEK